MKEKKEVIKHSAAIQIQNNITLLQRRAWNVLLAYAYDELPFEELHHVSIKDVIRSLEFNSENEGYLKEALEALNGCQVQWNILDKDGEMEWGITTLLAEAKIKKGICSYAYSPTLRKKLHNPRMYARLCLALQNKFDSKHALALWELCTDYLGAERDYGETPFILLADYRKLMGISVDGYPKFRDFNQRVIKEPVAEINRVSDFQVKADYQRHGRKVTAVKFKIHRVQMLPTVVKNQPDLFPDLQDMPIVVKMLKETGIAANDAWEVWQQGFNYVEQERRPAEQGTNGENAFLHYIQEKIHLLYQRKQVGKLLNPSGFLLTAIKKNYANAQFEQEQASAARKRQAAEKQKLQSQREHLLQEQSTAFAAVGREMIAAIPDLVEQAIADLLQKEDVGLTFSYEKGKTALENYQAHRYVTIAVNNWLETRFPERFAEVRKSFHP